ncbi:MAG: MlaD family protein [Gemmatimonadales bacterium]|jgi:phospholipid/cholesterol/gamma-HCH transport system substrate-binding protein
MDAHRVRWSQLRIGVLVTLVVTGAAFLIFFIDDVRGAFEGHYTLHFYTFTTQALRPRTSVWLAGQPVGQVGVLRFEPPRSGVPARLAVELDIGVDAQPFITEGAVAQVTTASLLGEAVVNILPAAEPAPALRDGDELPTAKELDPSYLTRRLEDLYDSVPPVTDRWRRLMGQVRHGDGTLPRVVRRPAELQELSVNLNRASATLDTIGSAAGGLAGLLADEDVRLALDRIGPRIQRLARLWDERSGSAGGFATDTALAARLGAIAEYVALIRERLESGRGSLGRLLYDEALATELERTRALLAELRADLAAVAGRGGGP